MATVKSTKTVYCYDCCKKHNKIKRQLYTKFGKKLISSDTKEKLSTIFQERVKNNQHKGWSYRNELSYPEKFFIDVLDRNNISYDKQVSVNGYFLDFVIILDNGLKIDLEIDGKQHYYEDRIKHDKIRDFRNRQSGYLIYRIAWNSPNSKKNGVKYGSLRLKAKIKQFLWWLNKMKETDQ